MALNMSHRPIFLEGCSENHGERFCSPLFAEGGVKNFYDYGRDRNKTGGSSQESISSDIVDLLPPDPFGMEMSTTFTAITGWLEDLKVDCFGYGGNVAGNNTGDYQLFTGLDILWSNAMRFHALPGSVLFDCNSHVPNGTGESPWVKPSHAAALSHCGIGPVDGTCGFPDTMETESKSVHLDFGLTCGLEGLSEIKAAGRRSCQDRYGSTTGFGAAANHGEASVRSDASRGFVGYSAMRDTNSGSSSIGFISREGFYGCAGKIEPKSVLPCGSSKAACDMDGCWVSGGRSTGSFSPETTNCEQGSDGSFSDRVGVPHLALDFALGYLTVQDLLSIERVCRSLRYTVRTDALLWQSIYVGQPLNEKITDDILLQLSARAQGNLNCLSLVECPRITDDCLKQVVLSNPKLTKLCVPGCTRLSINGILDILKTLKSMGTLRVKHLRVGGLYGVTIEQFEDLKTLLGLDCNSSEQSAHKPHIFQREKYLSFEDDRDIDIEFCPRCENLRLVYDCPSEVCRGKSDGVQACRACTICILRCVQCGQCINDGEYEETFCLEVLCPDCSQQQQQHHHLNPEEMPEEDGAFLKPSIIQELHDIIAGSC